MKRKSLAVLLSVTMLLTMACGIVNTLTGGGSGTTANLWSDVPPFEGATKANLEASGRKKPFRRPSGQLEFMPSPTRKGSRMWWTSIRLIA